MNVKKGKKSEKEREKQSKNRKKRIQCEKHRKGLDTLYFKKLIE